MCMFQPWENLDSLWQTEVQEEWDLPKSTEGRSGGIKVDPEPDHSGLQPEFKPQTQLLPPESHV